jgi:hypothetical protein
MPDQLGLSATEAGLLTVADRRGRVTSRAVVDQRNDPTAVERKELLLRLCRRGLLVEASATEDEVAYTITEQGRAALAVLDAMRRE